MTEPQIPNIGKYKIIELVGEGAMGVVYRAVDSVLDRTVAIKVMNESIARQADLRQRFLHEAQAAASLQHPNVVCIYDLGEVDGHLFIAMEFVHGVDLEKLLELHEPLSLQARLDIVIDVLTGLSFAHKRGIIHRDIKPANIRITDEGRAKIMDFGVAHLASSSLTSTGAILGTPSFMAPEQITEGKTSPATDIFAVGGILYQLLTQVRPFEGQTLQNLFFKIITEHPQSISELKPGLPPALDRIVSKAMAKEPALRYQSALEMAGDLSSVRAKLSGASYPETVSLSASVSSAIEQAKTSRTRTRNFAFAGAGAVFAIAALIGWSQLARPRQAVSAAAHDSSAVPAAAVGSRADVAAAPAVSTQSPRAAAPAPLAESTVSDRPPVPPAALRQAELQRRAEAQRAAILRQRTESQQRVTTAPRTANTRAVPAPTGAPQRGAQQQPSGVTGAALNAQAPAQSPVFLPPPAVTSPSSSPPPVVTRQLQTQTEEPAPSAPSPPTSADISPVIQAYARAIESRDIGAIRSVYPGLTANQARGFEQFFKAAQNINVTFRVTNVEGTPTSADARLTGSYNYVSSSGQAVHQPVSFAATLRNSGGAWRLVSVR